VAGTNLPELPEKERIALGQLRSAADPLSEIGQEGARRMLAAALQAEVDLFVSEDAEELLPEGRQRGVRHGHGPERSLQTGDRPTGGAASEGA